MHTLALLQTSGPSAIGLVLQTILALVVPIIATWMATQLTKVYTTVNGWAPWEVRILAACYAAVAAGIAHGLGITLPSTWGSLGAPEIQAIIGALGAMLIHRIVNPKSPTTTH